MATTALPTLAGMPEPEETEPRDAKGTDPNDPLDGDVESQQQLYQLFLKFVAEDRFARMVEVRECTHDREYWRGMQHIWWSDRDKCFNASTATQTWVNFGDYDIDDMPHFEFVTNIYQAGGLSAIALITGAPIAIRFFPVDPSNYDDVETAKTYDKLAKQIERWNPQKLMLQDEVYYMWCDGIIGLHTEYLDESQAPVPSENEEGEPARLGEGEQGEQGEKLVCHQCGWSAPAEHAEPPVPCPECGAELTEDNLQPAEAYSDLSALYNPQPAGQSQSSKGKQLLSCYGALEIRRPQWARKMSQFHYLSLDQEVHYVTLREEYPDKASKILPGASFGTDDSFERNARLAVAEGTNTLTQTGGAMASLCTCSKVWLRPAAFYQFEDEAVRDKFLKLFPKGCKITWAGPTYLKSKAQSMDDCWVVRHALPGDGQHRNGMGSSMVSPQDRYNTETNIRAETYEYGIPRTFMDSNMFSDEAEGDQRSEPGADVMVNLRQGEDMRMKVMQVRADSISQDMVQDMADIRGPIMQLLTGEYPAAIGNPDMGTDTAQGMAIQRDQAMGRMGIPYGQLKQAYADLITLACDDYRAHSKEPLSIPRLMPSGDFESDIIDVAALEGNAQAYPEGDEAFPELWNQKRQVVIQMMDNPAGQQLAQVPENARTIVKLMGVPELVAPGADSEEKQLREITELIKGLPVEVDPVVDDSKVESDVCQRYLRSKEGQDLKRENPPAYETIRQHKQQHDQVAAQAAQGAMPPMKPISPNLSVNMKDLPPTAQQRVMSDMGVQVSTPELVMNKLLGQKKAPGSPPPGANAGKGNANVQ